MEQNIFQVVKESDIDDITVKHSQNLVIIMYSSKDCPPCKTIKPKFVGLSKQHKDVFFIYVDRNKYEYDVTINKYFKEYEYTPTFLFYFNKSKVAFIEGAHEPALVKTLLILKQKIEEGRVKMLQQEKLLEEKKIQEAINAQLPNIVQHPSQVIKQPSLVQQPQVQIVHDEDTDELSKKIEILNKLKELVQFGAKLTQIYNLDSDYKDLIFELRFQTNPQFRQQVLSTQQNQPIQQNKQVQPSAQPIQAVQPAPILTDQQNLLQKKQEQVKQIQELSMLQQKMQQQSFQKLQQLKKIQMMKEQYERNNTEKKE